MIFNASVRIEKADNGFIVTLSRWDSEKEDWRQTMVCIFKNKTVAFAYAQKELGEEITESGLMEVHTK